LRGAVNFHQPQKSISGWGVPLKKMVVVRHEGRNGQFIERMRRRELGPSASDGKAQLTAWTTRDNVRTRKSPQSFRHAIYLFQGRWICSPKCRRGKIREMRSGTKSMINGID
jgi:hypothetical protein